jgi:hypothetical protein
MWRHVAARVDDTIIIHVRALDAAVRRGMEQCLCEVQKLEMQMPVTEQKLLK